MESWRGERVTEKVQSLRWKIWIGYDDGLIYRMQRQVTTGIEISEEKWNTLGRRYFKSAPDRGRDLTTVLDLRIKDYTAEMDYNLPPSVQQFFRHSSKR